MQPAEQPEQCAVSTNEYLRQSQMISCSNRADTVCKWPQI